MNSTGLIVILALAGCDDLPGENESIAYEGPARIAPTAPDVAEDRAAIDGRYGASAADCDPGNRYMTEYLEIENGILAYRGERTAIGKRSDDRLRLRGGERLAIEDGRIMRWPDDRAKRTVYTRCD